MLYMFDTNVLSEYLKGNSRIVGRTESLEISDEIGISNIAWFEIIRGRMAAVLTADDVGKLITAQARFDQDLHRLDGFARYGVDESAAVKFDSLRANKRSKKMNRPDLLIACIALANKAVLVTRNVKDFANVPALQIQNWFE